jgi:hypothetical protein
MNVFPRIASLPLLVLAALFAAGCHGNQDQNAANANQAGATPAATPDQSQSSDPASSANLAPISTDTSSATQSNAGSGQAAPDQSVPVPDASSDTDDSFNGEQPVATASEPPPPLPDYDQPQDPGDGYIWTPGYWNYASAGYYWVPGVWVQAPYEGALWTPGYWGTVHGRYGFFHGYWGPHIGFYGGVNYGFGYVGTGYQGGYWNSGHFFYNRTVNNINVTIVHNVYTHPVPSNTVRISFHGGQGGIQIRPRPAELVALREPHAAPMHAQLENEHAASANRAQFVAVNHGRPASLVVAKPLEADHGVHPVVAPPARNMPHAAPETHPNPPQPAHGQPARPEAAPRPGERPAEHPAPTQHPVPAQHPAEHPAPAQHAAEHSAPAQRPAEHPAPAQHPAEHSAERPAPHPEAHPAPKSKPAPEHPKKPQEKPPLV